MTKKDVPQPRPDQHHDWEEFLGIEPGSDETIIQVFPENAKTVNALNQALQADIGKPGEILEIKVVVNKVNVPTS